ncbi:MAG: hypothetical protein R3C61_28955 [Bacteroidia bacterium]
MKSVIIANLIIQNSATHFLLPMADVYAASGRKWSPIRLSGTIWIAPKTIQSTDKSSFKTISDKATVENSVMIYDREAESGAGAFINVDVV